MIIAIQILMFVLVVLFGMGTIASKDKEERKQYANIGMVSITSLVIITVSKIIWG